MNIQIGDRITFRAITRGGAPKLTRVINGFFQGCPTVRAHGCTNFIVRPDEISDIERKEESAT